MKRVIGITLLLVTIFLFFGCFPDPSLFHSLINISVHNDSPYEVTFYSRRVGIEEEKEFRNHGIITANSSKSYLRASGYTYDMYCKDNPDGTKTWGPLENVYIDFRQDYEWTITENTEFYPSVNCRVWNFEGNYQDKDGVDDWGVLLNSNFSSSIKKFGNYSITKNSAGSSVLQNIYEFQDGESQTFAFWIYFSNISMGLDRTIFHFVGNNSIELILTKDYKLKIRAYLNKVYYYYTAPANITAGVWYYLALLYNKDLNILYLLINTNLYDSSIKGIWTSGISGDIYLNPQDVSDYYTAFFDELLLCPDQFINPDVLIQHYNHNVAWGGTYLSSE